MILHLALYPIGIVDICLVGLSKEFLQFNSEFAVKFINGTIYGEQIQEHRTYTCLMTITWLIFICLVVTGFGIGIFCVCHHRQGIFITFAYVCCQITNSFKIITNVVFCVVVITSLINATLIIIYQRLSSSGIQFQFGIGQFPSTYQSIITHICNIGIWITVSVRNSL